MTEEKEQTEKEENIKIEIPKHLRIRGFRFILLDKKTKKPFEPDWPGENNYEYDNPKLLKHLEEGGNYGVLCGVETDDGFLVVSDIDDSTIIRDFRKSLPKTFSVKTGGGGNHFYYLVDEPISKIVLQRNGKHYGELQSTGAQVVGPSCIHPSGKRYEIINNVKIKKIPLSKLLLAIAPYREEIDLAEKEIEGELKGYGNSDVASIPITQVINVSKFKKRGGEYQGENPWHGSETKLNLCVSPTKNVAFCFRCREGISPIKALALNEKIISNCTDKLDGEKFKQALESAYDSGLLNRAAGSSKREYSGEEDAYMNIKKFNRPTNIFVGKEGLLYQNTSLGYKNDVSYFEPSYKIYKANIGAGNKPIFLYSERYEKIELGESALYLVPLEDKEVKAILKDMKKAGYLFTFVEKDIGLRIEDMTVDDVIKMVVQRHMQGNVPLLFKKTLAIPLEELKKIKDFYELGKLCLTAKIKGDDNLNDTYLSFLPEVNPQTVTSRQVMQGANHGLIITNPGVGKTTDAKIVTGEPTISDCSSANLLGFATADSKVSGKLDGRVKATIIDEIQELKNEEVLGKIHTYMEQGECDISKGIGIKCKGHSTIVFQGNPKEDIKSKMDSSDNLMNFLFIKKYRDFLMKISSNTEAFARRIGEVDIGNNFKPTEGSGVAEEEFEKGQQILRTIAEGFRDDFSKLLKNTKIVDWINKGYDKDYYERLDKIIEKCSDTLIRDFFKGQKLNYRHVRGGAVRRAWLKEGIGKVLEKGALSNEDYDSVIAIAENFFSLRVNRNLKSYIVVLDLLNSEAYKQIAEVNLKSLSPDYAKIMFYSLFEYAISTLVTRIIPLATLEPAYGLVKERLKITGKYEFFSRVKDAFDKYVGHLNFYLEEYGLSYDTTMSSFIIQDQTKFKAILEVYKKCKVQ